MSNLAERSSFVVLILGVAFVVLAALALAHTVSIIMVVIALWVTVVVNALVQLLQRRAKRAERAH